MPYDAGNKSTLKKEGLKNTPHRNAILDMLGNSAEPMDAGQIFLRLQAGGTEINLSSVYRILEALASKGLLLKSNLAGGAKAVFELNRAEHRHHLVCSKCMRTIPVEGCPLEEYVKALSERTGFNVTGHRLELYGLCKGCRDAGGLSSAVAERTEQVAQREQTDR